MINFRYHIISITAVFLALGLGLALGTGFGNRALLDSLRSTQGRLNVEVREKRSTNDKLAAEVGQRLLRDERFGAEAAKLKGPLTQGALDQVPVLMVAPTGIDQKMLDRLRSALLSSGARFAGTLRLDKRLALNGDNVVTAAQVVRTTSTNVPTVRKELVAQLSTVLLQGSQPSVAPPPGSGITTTVPSTTVPSTTAPVSTVPASTAPAPTTAVGPETTTTVAAVPTTHAVTTTTAVAGAGEAPSSTETKLITDLRSEGFLSFEPPENANKDDPVVLDGDFRYLFVSEPNAELADSALLLPLMRQMSASGDVPAVLASAAEGSDPEATREAVVGPVRSDAVLSQRLSTVDDLENYYGYVTVVLTLVEVGDGRHGHYGWGPKATAALPKGP